MEGEREGEREGGREGGRERGREKGREGTKEGTKRPIRFRKERGKGKTDSMKEKRNTMNSEDGKAIERRSQSRGWERGEGGGEERREGVMKRPASQCLSVTGSDLVLLSKRHGVCSSHLRTSSSQNLVLILEPAHLRTCSSHLTTWSSS